MPCPTASIVVAVGPFAGEFDDQLQIGLDPAEESAEFFGIERVVAIGIGRGEVFGIDRKLAGAQPIVAGRLTGACSLVVFFEYQPDRRNEGSSDDSSITGGTVAYLPRRVCS